MERSSKRSKVPFGAKVVRLHSGISRALAERPHGTRQVQVQRKSALDLFEQELSSTASKEASSRVDSHGQLSHTADLAPYCFRGELEIAFSRGSSNLRYAERLVESRRFLHPLHLEKVQLGKLACLTACNAPRPRVLILLLHGHGGNATDLMYGLPLLLSRFGLGLPVVFVAPNAPLPMSHEEVGGDALPNLTRGSYKWWDLGSIKSWFRALHMYRRGTGDVPNGLHYARKCLDSAVVEAMRQYNIEAGHLAVVGFSQGAMLALDSLFRFPVPPFFVGILSGAPICHHVWREMFKKATYASRARMQRTVLFQSHGIYDPVIPFPIATVLKRYLAKLGLPVDCFFAFPGKHELTPVIFQKAAEMLADAAPSEVVSAPVLHFKKFGQSGRTLDKRAHAEDSLVAVPMFGPTKLRLVLHLIGIALLRNKARGSGKPCFCLFYWGGKAHQTEISTSLFWEEPFVLFWDTNRVPSSLDIQVLEKHRFSSHKVIYTFQLKLLRFIKGEDKVEQNRDFRVQLVDTTEAAALELRLQFCSLAQPHTSECSLVLPETIKQSFINTGGVESDQEKDANLSDSKSEDTAGAFFARRTKRIATAPAMRYLCSSSNRADSDSAIAGISSEALRASASVLELSNSEYCNRAAKALRRRDD